MYSRRGGVFDIESKRKTVEEAAEKEQQPGFWDDPKEAEKFLKTVSPVKSWVSSYDELISMIGDIEVLSEFGEESAAELRESCDKLKDKLEALEMRNMLGEEGDNLGAILTINSGAGGTESNDWSAMLMRMYMRWGERNGYKVTVTDVLDGEEADRKSVV